MESKRLQKKLLKKRFVIPVLLLLLILAGYVFLFQKSLTVENANHSIGTGIIILDGNIQQLTDSGNQKRVIFEVSDFESDFITEFTDVVISSDSSHFCFLGQTPISAPVLYHAPINGSIATKIAVGAANCVWAPNNKQLAFTNTAKNKEKVDVFAYDLRTERVTVLTDNAAQVGTYRVYGAPEWTESSNRLLAPFTEYGIADKVLRREGISQIDISEKKVVDK